MSIKTTSSIRRTSKIGRMSNISTIKHEVSYLVYNVGNVWVVASENSNKPLFVTVDRNNAIKAAKEFAFKKKTGIKIFNKGGAVIKKIKASEIAA